LTHINPIKVISENVIRFRGIFAGPFSYLSTFA